MNIQLNIEEMCIDVLDSISAGDGNGHSPRVGLIFSTDENRGPTDNTNSHFLGRPFGSSPLSRGPAATVDPSTQTTSHQAPFAYVGGQPAWSHGGTFSTVSSTSEPAPEDSEFAAQDSTARIMIGMVVTESVKYWSRCYHDRRWISIRVRRCGSGWVQSGSCSDGTR